MHRVGRASTDTKPKIGAVTAPIKLTVALLCLGLIVLLSSFMPKSTPAAQLERSFLESSQRLSLERQQPKSSASQAQEPQA